MAKTQRERAPKATNQDAPAPTNQDAEEPTNQDWKKPTNEDGIVWTAQKIRLGDLTPWERNPRRISVEAGRRLRESFKEFGQVETIAIGPTGEVYNGHQRLKELIHEFGGDFEVDARVSSRVLTEKEREKLTIYLHKGAAGDWDYEMLAGQFDLGELRESWGTEEGQLWELGRHRLLCGDCTLAADVARVLAGTKPQLMVTDPPYGVEYDPTWRADAGVNKNQKKMRKVKNDDRADWYEAWALFPGDVVYVYHAGIMTPIVQASIERCGFETRAQIIWAKDRMALSRGDYHWHHEPIIYAVRKGVRPQSLRSLINTRSAPDISSILKSSTGSAPTTSGFVIIWESVTPSAVAIRAKVLNVGSAFP